MPVLPHRNDCSRRCVTLNRESGAFNMNTPHTCICEICRREMSPMFIAGIDYSDPKMTAAAPAPDLTGYSRWATCASCGGFHEVGKGCGIEVK